MRAVLDGPLQRFHLHVYPGSWCTDVEPSAENSLRDVGWSSTVVGMRNLGGGGLLLMDRRKPQPFI